MSKICINQEAVIQMLSVKKVFLKISQNAQNTCVRISFIIKLQASACNFIKKEVLAQVFSCKFCEIFKKTSFYKTPPVAVSEGIRINIFLISFAKH